MTARIVCLICFTVSGLFSFGCISVNAATFNIANGDVSGFKSAITTANTNSQDDVINLASGGTYTLTTVDNGANGLPVIRTDGGHTLTINGSRTTITRSTAANTPVFRILQIGGFAVVTLNGVTVSNGSSNDRNFPGGGIDNDHGTLTLISSTVSANGVSDSQVSVAIALGGGIFNDHGNLMLQNSTISGNFVSARSDNGSSAIARGGALYNDDGIMKIKNCTISGNGASASSGSGMFGAPDARGGGIFNVGSPSGDGSVIISNSTLVSNSSSNSSMFPTPSVGIDNSGSSASVTLGNTILAGTALSNFQGMIVSNGYNLSTDNGGGFLTATGDQLNVFDPKLGQLGDNGGLTQTHALLPGSPAIDKGKRNAVPSLAVTTDQRGVIRPFDFPGIGPAAGGDSSDIGALETTDIVQRGPTFTVNTLDDHDDTSCGTEDCTLREAILAANNHVGSDTIKFASKAKGNINLTGALPNLSTNITLQGPGANGLTVRRNAGGDYRIFTVSNGTNVGPVVTISGLTIANGRLSTSTFPDNLGAGIYNDHGTLTVNNCSISNNAAPGAGFGAGAGGAIYNNGASSGQAMLTLTNTTINGNSAGFFGGGICNDGTTNGMATANLTNCTLTGNISSNGGGVANLGAANGHASLVVHSLTFDGNTASFGGALYIDAQSNGMSMLTISNTILNTGRMGANFSVSNGAIVTSQGHSISNDAAGGAGGTAPGGFLNGTGDKRNTDPKLDPLGLKNNGGTTSTIGLQATSPAINNAVNAPAHDQRNYVRNGPPDIGAFEFGGFPGPVTDFNLDGMTDYVLFNASNRASAIWNLIGNRFISSKFGPTLPSGWRLAGVADFDQNGGPDYLLVNSTTRQTAVWFLNNATFVNAAFGPTLPAGWQLVTAADINDDGTPDYILFNPASRATAIWFLDGTRLVSTALGPMLPAGWSLISAVDFNANAKPDYLLFKSATRQTAVWFLNGTTFVNASLGPTLPSGWMLSGASEFNGNGKPDYVLFNASTRQTAIWLLNGLTLSSGLSGPTLPAGFSLVAP